MHDDLEALRILKARYFRFLDTKDWTSFRALFTDDLVVDTVGSGGSVIHGADEFVAFVTGALSEAVTVHHGHTPELELTSPTTAAGVWAMEDTVRWPNGQAVHGFGHYHETYEKFSGGWRIASSTLTRLLLDYTPAPEASS